MRMWRESESRGMEEPPTLRNYAVTVLKRSVATWHGDEGWFALFAYLSVLVLLFLFSGIIADIAGEFVHKTLAFAAIGWLLILVLVITPYRMWREGIEQVRDLNERLNTRAQTVAAMKSLGEIWEQATHFLNDLTKKPILSGDDHAKIKEIENNIYESVEVI